MSFTKARLLIGLCTAASLFIALAAPVTVFAQDETPTATPETIPVLPTADPAITPTDTVLVSTDTVVATMSPADVTVEATETLLPIEDATPEPDAIVSDAPSLIELTNAIVDQAAAVSNGDPSGTLGVGAYGAPAGASFRYFKSGGANPANGTCNYDSGTNIVTCYWDKPIQTAINDAAVGSTVSVEAGNYTEELKIEKSLTLLGLGNPTIYSPVSLTNTMPGIDGSGNPVVLHPIIFVNGADNVTIDGFTVDGNGNGNLNYRFVGIGYYNSSGTISDTTVTGIHDTPVGGMQGGLGIYAYNNDGTPRTLDVENNTVTDYQKGGMVFKGDGLTVNTIGNTITGYGSVPFIAQNGIQYSQGVGGTIQDNTISGHWYSGSSASSAGIIIWNDPAAITIDGNTISNNQIGISGTNSGQLTITDNTISGSVTGISESHTSGTIGGIIQENTITGNTLGVYVDDPSILVNFNNFYGNINGLQFEDTFKTGGTLDATQNYWGCPAGAGCFGSAPQTLTKCADENGTCSFTGTRDVTYGANGKFYTKQNVTSSIACNNATFGDPIVGTVKACYTVAYSAPACDTANGPTDMTKCADENGTCSFTGTRDVTYGANGVFTTLYGVTGGTPCTNAVFGDPLVGTVKACYILFHVDTGSYLSNPVGVPGSMEISGGDAQSTLVGTTFSLPLTVHLVDANGLDVESTVVQFAAPVSGSSAVLSAFSVTTDENGMASVTATANGVDGSYVVTASVGDLTADFNLTNIPLPATGDTSTSNPVAPFVIPVTGGQTINLSCVAGTTLALEDGTKLTFNQPLCNHSASLSAEQENTLPAGLPQGNSFGMGATYVVTSGVTKLDVLPAGVSAILSFPKPAGIGENSAVLFWDVQASQGAGGWVELSQAGAITLGDTRVVVHGLYEQDGRMLLVTNFTGTFILVSK